MRLRLFLWGRYLSLVTGVVLGVGAGAVTDVPLWNIRNLNGIKSFHDGANCYGSASAVLGYTDDLIYVSNSEFRYTLENFCTPVSTGTQAGDVVVVVDEGTLAHAAIDIDATTEFDKNSVAGQFGQDKNGNDYSYGKRLFSNSKFFNTCTGEDCHLETYRCTSSSAVRPQIARCADAQILMLRKVFGRHTFDPHVTYQLPEESLLEMIVLIADVDSRSGRSTCDLYFLTTAFSTLFNLYNIKDEQSLGPEWSSEIESLSIAVKALYRRIADYDATPSTVKILNEDQGFATFVDPGLPVRKLPMRIQ